MFSNRKFQIVICSNSGNIIIEPISLEDLFHVPSNNDNLPEWEYAIKDITDMVLDLKANESMYFQPNRDDNNSKGIIYRMS